MRLEPEATFELPIARRDALIPTADLTEGGVADALPVTGAGVGGVDVVEGEIIHVRLELEGEVEGGGFTNAHRLAIAADGRISVVGFEPLHLDSELDVVAAMGPLQVVDNGVAVLGGGAGIGGGRPIGGELGGAAVSVEGDNGHIVGGIAVRQVVDARGR